MTLVFHCPDQRKHLGIAFVDWFDKWSSVGTDAYVLDVQGDEGLDYAAHPVLRRWTAGFIRFLEWPVVPTIPLVLATQFQRSTR